MIELCKLIPFLEELDLELKLKPLVKTEIKFEEEEKCQSDVLFEHENLQTLSLRSSGSERPRFMDQLVVGKNCRNLRALKLVSFYNMRVLDIDAPNLMSFEVNCPNLKLLQVRCTNTLTHIEVANVTLNARNLMFYTRDGIMKQMAL